MFYSIHNYDIVINGKKTKIGNWELSCQITDTFDFTEFVAPWEERFLKNPVGWGGNNAAFISENLGAIVPMDVEVNLNMVVSGE